MARYLQKISLRPYTETEIWTGWELEGREAPHVDHVTHDLTRFLRQLAP